MSPEKVCGGSIIGGGRAVFEFVFPEAPLIRKLSKLTVYNTGVDDGVTTFYVVAFVPIPAPRMIPIRGEIERIHKGRYGLRAVAQIPVIAGGSGSLRSFSLRIKRLFEYKGAQRSYAMARCPNRSLNAEISALFKNDALEPGVAPTTLIKGTVASPCTPAS